LLLCATGALAQQITGDYVESRNMDVYSGQCYANSEIGLVGDQAIVGWRISKGSWNGVQLDGLHVVGITKGADTLGTPYTDAYPAKAVLIVDEKASAEQRAALTAFAQTMGGRMFENIVRTEVVPISLTMEYHGEHPAAATLNAGKLAAIKTRPLTVKDKICGHEEVLFQPLTPVGHVMPAVAEVDQFAGLGLNSVWMLNGKRSAFIGSFVR
jgi:hypothetical protein